MHQSRFISFFLLALYQPALAVPSTPTGSVVNQNQSAAESFPFHRVPYIHNTCGKFKHDRVRKCHPHSPGGGPCCSEFGWCGHGPAYCDKGCQPEFGKCGPTSSHHRQKKCGPKHKNKKCNDDECCSSNGVCGKSEAFCGKHCQSDFGRCTEHHNGTEDESEEHRCGEGLPLCPWQQCCSAAGYCGIGKEFCSVPENCQRDFGYCDSDDTPEGMNHTNDPRDYLGKVAYGKVIDKCTKSSVAALSFNDGPYEYTESILDTLRDHNATATFFISGINNGKGAIDRTPKWVQIIKRMMMEGHQIGSHGWSHRHMSNLSLTERKDEMIQNEVAISNIVGRYPTYMRAPYLSCDENNGCLKDMNDLAYHVVSFEVDSQDWMSNTSFTQMTNIIQTALANKTANDSMFLIQHDINENAPALLRFTLDHVAAIGWKAVTVGECLEDPSDNWYRAPIWNSAATTAEDGCVVTDVNFCGSIKPFHDKQVCKESVDDCFHNLGICWNVLGKQHTSCVEYDNICTAHMRHCEACEGDACDIKNWVFNRWKTTLQH